MTHGMPFWKLETGNSQVPPGRPAPCFVLGPCFVESRGGIFFHLAGSIVVQIVLFLISATTENSTFSQVEDGCIQYTLISKICCSFRKKTWGAFCRLFIACSKQFSGFASQILRVAAVTPLKGVWGIDD